MMTTKNCDLQNRRQSIDNGEVERVGISAQIKRWTMISILISNKSRSDKPKGYNAVKPAKIMVKPTLLKQNFSERK